MSGLSALMVWWHAIHVFDFGIVSISPGSGILWHSLHLRCAVTVCCLWLNGMGWIGAVDGSAAKSEAENRTSKQILKSSPYASVRQGNRLTAWRGHKWSESGFENRR
jgi:hypothetical protein